MTAPPDLRLDDLQVRLAGRTIVDHLDLEVAPGSVVGLVGPNGSGKSTVLRCVYRALRPAGGTVRVDGQDLAGRHLRTVARQVAALTQDSGSDLDFTVAELVALGRTPHRGENRALTAADHAVCLRAMAQLDVLDIADRGVLSLSGGERQRVLAARALAQEPSVLVLDEPTNHLDIRHQLDLLRVLRRTGVTVLVVLHDLNLAAAACDRLGVLSAGRLVAAGTPWEVLTEDLVAEVFDVRARVVAHPLSGVPQLLFTLDDPGAAP